MQYNFCPQCGNTLKQGQPREAGRERCSGCGTVFYRNPAVGVAAIVTRGNKVLLGKRAGSYQGRWCIPCGYVEWGEDVRAAVIREFYEETGLIIEPGPVFAVLSNFHDRDRQTVGIWFLAREAGGELAAGDDLLEVGFFGRDELPQLAFPTDVEVLKKMQGENLI